MCELVWGELGKFVKKKGEEVLGLWAAHDVRACNCPLRTQDEYRQGQSRRTRSLCTRGDKMRVGSKLLRQHANLRPCRTTEANAAFFLMRLYLLVAAWSSSAGIVSGWLPCPVELLCMCLPPTS